MGDEITKRESVALLSDLESKLAHLYRECDRLRHEILKLEAELGRIKNVSLNEIAYGEFIQAAPVDSEQLAQTSFGFEPETDEAGETGASYLPENFVVTKASPMQKKYELFMSLFAGRPDVHARRFESAKTGKAGYMPVCRNEFVRSCCTKGIKGAKRIPCRKCEFGDFPPIDMKAFVSHIRGEKENCGDVLAAYPMDIAEMCSFIVADFDDENRSGTDAARAAGGDSEESMVSAALAFKQTCEESGVPAYLERSRSGRGMHVWIFFDGRVEAKQARRLCTSILTLAMEKRPGLSFSSYDRLIPSQDRLPDGGFGNLIALPLQGRAGKRGNSLFVDSDLRQYDDQWEHLSLVKKISPNEIDALLSEMSVGDSYGALLQDEQGETGGEPWEKKKPQAKLTEDDFAGDVEITRANMLHIGKRVLSPRAINAIKRLAAFKNPDFFKAQAMRLPTYDKPRIISTSEETEEYVSVPRGAEAGLLRLLKDAGAKFELRDLRENGKPLKLKFKGKLREEQNLAAEAMLKRDIGVLSATTAFGKTVVAAFLIASRKVNALVLVHNRELLAQWRESLDEFLDIKTAPPEKFTPTGKKKKVDKIGEYCGVKKNLSGLVDVAMLQSLSKDGETDDFVKDYGMVIVDECHHVPAVSFETVLKHVNAKYIYGLTATPTRDDGKHAILFLQCGPIRHAVDAKSQAAKRPFEHYMIPRFTGLLPTSVHQDSGMPFLLNDVAADEKRNKMIARDVASAIDSGRSPLVLTERAGHVKTLSDLLSANFENVITMVGGMGAKEKRFARERLAAFERKGKFALVATGKYIGEGFDFPRLDTLFLALPIAWKGKVAQYTGRLHRNYEGKEDVIVYDYVDANIPVLEKMYYKRIKGYKALGYKTMMKEQGPPSQNFIYGAAEYLAAFKADCAAAKSEIVISSPNLSKGKALRLMPILISKLIDNIVITIFTKPSSPSSKNRNETGNLPAKPAGELQEAGIHVIEKEGLHQRFAIIDKTIVWYGSINPLGYAAADDNMLRLEDEGVGEELARGLVGGLSSGFFMEIH